MLEIFILIQKVINLERTSQHAVIIHANTSNGIKIPTFEKKSYDVVGLLVQCPFNPRPTKGVVTTPLTV